MGGRRVRDLSPSNGMPIQSQWSSGRYNIVCSLTIALFEVVSLSQQRSGSFVENSMLIDTGPFPLATLGHGALKTIYTGAILPLLQYGALIWIKALAKASYKIKLIRVQRLINIRIAKSFRTFSKEALCIINGLTPIDIKLEEVAQLYQITRRNNRCTHTTLASGH